MRRWQTLVPVVMFAALTALLVLAVTQAAAVAQAPAVAQGEASSGAAPRRLRTDPWPAEVLDAVAHLAVQSSGRIKPLFSEVRLHIKTINGKESVKTAWDEKLGPMAWLLDCLFFPEQARDYKSILVDDDRVINSIGLSFDDRKRQDRYSMNELEPAFARLGALAEQLRQKKTSDRSSLDSQTINLAHKVPVYRYLLSALDYARLEYDVAAAEALQTAFKGRERVRFLELVERFDEVRQAIGGAGHSDDPGLNRVTHSIGMTLQLAGLLKFVPPAAAAEETYLSAEDVMMRQLQGGDVTPVDMGLLKRFETLSDQRHDMAKLSAGILAICADLRARVEARGEYSKIGLETRFYQADYFYTALHWFLGAFVLGLAFLFMPAAHLSPKAGVRMVHRAFFWPILAMILYGEGLIITGIVMRCVIRDRPPVTTPYEAVLFIAACVLLITLAIEFIFRNGFALIAAAGFGCVGMMVAAWHEAAESADSMAPLVAVLDTNFWLATHVTMITLGYAAGVFAAFLAHFYLIAKLFSVFGVGGGDLKKFCSVVSRVIYGVLCFGLVFAIVGTILGGVWANDSWGRFWGWDPKENGALMLVLVYLAIAHARMGGYIREIGLAISSLIVGITVMWAFWGVNLLQIGLHSYGFDETKARAWAYYRWTEWTVVGLGVVVWGLNRWMTASAGAKAAA